LNQSNNKLCFALKAYVFWVLQLLKGFFHTGDGSQVPDNLLGCLDKKLLVKFLVVVEMNQQSEERMFIQNPDIVSLVFIKDVAKIDVEKTLD